MPPRAVGELRPCHSSRVVFCCRVAGMGTRGVSPTGSASDDDRDGAATRRPRDDSDCAASDLYQKAAKSFCVAPVVVAVGAARRGHVDVPVAATVAHLPAGSLALADHAVSGGAPDGDVEAASASVLGGGDSAANVQFAGVGGRVRRSCAGPCRVLSRFARSAFRKRTDCMHSL